MSYVTFRVRFKVRFRVRVRVREMKCRGMKRGRWISFSKKCLMRTIKHRC